MARKAFYTHGWPCHGVMTCINGTASKMHHFLFNLNEPPCVPAAEVLG